MSVFYGLLDRPLDPWNDVASALRSMIVIFVAVGLLGGWTAGRKSDQLRNRSLPGS
jgi:hypothetical protein